MQVLRSASSLLCPAVPGLCPSMRTPAGPAGPAGLASLAGLAGLAGPASLKIAIAEI